MTRVHPGFGADNLVRNTVKAPRYGDPLPRLLDQMLVRAGAPATVERAASRPWASALFEGRRHVVRLCLGGTDAADRYQAFVKDLESAEWTLPGHFVADISVDDGHADGDSAWLDLSALTIQDW